MSIISIREEKLEKVVQYCKNIQDIQGNKIFINSFNTAQLIQNINIVRSFFFKSVIKVYGEVQQDEIERIAILRIPDATENISSIEILMMSIDDLGFVKEVINKVVEFCKNTCFCKVKIVIDKKNLNSTLQKIVEDNNFLLEVRYEIGDGEKLAYSKMIKERGRNEI